MTEPKLHSFTSAKKTEIFGCALSFGNTVQPYVRNVCAYINFVFAAFLFPCVCFYIEITEGLVLILDTAIMIRLKLRLLIRSGSVFRIRRSNIYIEITEGFIVERNRYRNAFTRLYKYFFIAFKFFG